MGTRNVVSRVHQRCLWLAGDVLREVRAQAKAHPEDKGLQEALDHQTQLYRWITEFATEDTPCRK